MARSTDILIVGGGVIGLTCAVRLREAGATVAVYDRGDFGREASWAGAGIIPPGNPDRTATPIDKLRAIGSATLPDFSRELSDTTGIDNGYRRNGGLEFLEPEDEYAVALWAAEGIAFEKWAADRRDEPNLALARPCYHFPDMAQLRNPWHMRALVERCRRLGVALHPHTGVESWTMEKTVRGIQLASGDRAFADRTILAAGPWSERLLHDLGVRPGIHPVRGQILLLNSSAEVLRRTVLHGKRYLVPRGDGRILVGSTEEPRAGFEKTTTASALLELRTFANDLVPKLRDAATEASWAGLRPGSADGLPFIGPVPGYENVIVASGHYRAGIQLSPGTAQFVTELVYERPTCVPRSAFALDRRPDVRAKAAFRS